jgi:O-antigen ligase
MVRSGVGSALKFGLETAGSKSHFSRMEAAFLHNGYAYYLMKTGIIGLLMYGCFLLHLAVRAISPKSWKALPEAKMQRKVC